MILTNGQIQEIEKIIRYTFKSKDYLIIAFTHSSYANVHSKKSNERLEFLGDSIINFVSAEYLFEKFDVNEGELSKARANLVSQGNLSRIINELNLIKYLKSSSALKTYSDAVKCDLYEAIVGSIYFDGGIKKAKEFIKFTLQDEFSKNDFFAKCDYKTMLQEYLQSKKKKFSYKTIDSSGPSHLPEFVVALEINGQIVSKAKGNKLKTAQQEAARIACLQLGVIN